MGLIGAGFEICQTSPSGGMLCLNTIKTENSTKFDSNLWKYGNLQQKIPVKKDIYGKLTHFGLTI